MRPTNGDTSVTFAVRAGDGLVQAEEQRQITVNPFLLEDLCGLDALPGGGDLYQDALATDAGLIVLGDDVAGPARGFFSLS